MTTNSFINVGQIFRPLRAAKNQHYPYTTSTHPSLFDIKCQTNPLIRGSASMVEGGPGTSDLTMSGSNTATPASTLSPVFNVIDPTLPPKS
jgi:hypothetical protein